MSVLNDLFSHVEVIFRDVLDGWNAWHQDNQVDPGQVVQDSKNIAAGVGQVMASGEEAFDEITKQLVEKHPTIAPNHARVLAALASESLPKKPAK